LIGVQRRRKCAARVVVFDSEFDRIAPATWQESLAKSGREECFEPLTAATGCSAANHLDTMQQPVTRYGRLPERRMQFQDLIYQNMVMPGARLAAKHGSHRLQIARHAFGGVGNLHLQGDLSQTGNPLDCHRGRDCFQVLLRRDRRPIPAAANSTDAQGMCDRQRESAAARGGSGGRDLDYDRGGWNRVGHTRRAERRAAGGLDPGGCFPNPGGSTASARTVSGTTASAIP